MRLPIAFRILSSLVIMPLACLSATAGDWPGFRGPTGMGISDAAGLPLVWGGPDDTNVIWKAPLLPADRETDPDQNQSSPVVSGGRVVLTLSYWPAGVEKSLTLPQHHVVCHRAEDGVRLWDTEVEPGPLTLQDLRGGYTAPTPAIADGRVFALFGSGVLHALDLDGMPLWSFTLPGHDQFDVAICSSPVVHGDSVLLLLERKKPHATLIALDVESGALRWSKARPESDFGHMTPVLADTGTGKQLLVSATEALQGIDPASGEVLWHCSWGQQLWPVSSPVLSEGLVYAIGGRGGHPGAVVDPTGAGDVTETHLRWRIGPMSEGLSSPVASGDLVFRLNSPGILRCARLSTGEELFRERLPGADSAVSPFVTPDGRIYFASAGKSVVIAVAPELRILGESDLGDPSQAAAAVSGKRIFLKGRRNLFAVGLPKP